MSYIEDNEAINEYMKSVPAKTDKARDLQNQFFAFWQKGSWWDKNMSSNWFDEARTRRNQFNLANTTNVVEKQQVEKILATGLTREQMRGGNRPKVDVKTGAVGSQNKAPTTQAGIPKLSRNLKKGIQGNDVKAWQAFLGLTPATGVFDSITDVKTRAYQTEKGLKADGIVGPKTWTAAFENYREPSRAVVQDFSIAPTTAAAINAAVKLSQPKVPSQPTDIHDVAQEAVKVVASKGQHNKRKHSAHSVPASAPSPSNVPTVPVNQAGMLSLGAVEKWPTWAKIVGGLGTIGALAVGLKYHEQHTMRK